MPDNGYAFFATPGRGMSHNRRTLQDAEFYVLRRQLTQERRFGVSEVGAFTLLVDAQTSLPADHFAFVAAPSRPSIWMNLPQPLRQNKTAGLVTGEGADADGN
jgi:hypothetical protein